MSYQDRNGRPSATSQEYNNLRVYTDIAPHNRIERQQFEERMNRRNDRSNDRHNNNHHYSASNNGSNDNSNHRQQQDARGASTYSGLGYYNSNNTDRHRRGRSRSLERNQGGDYHDNPQYRQSSQQGSGYPSTQGGRPAGRRDHSYSDSRNYVGDPYGDYRNGQQYVPRQYRNDQQGSNGHRHHDRHDYNCPNHQPHNNHQDDRHRNDSFSRDSYAPRSNDHQPRNNHQDGRRRNDSFSQDRYGSAHCSNDQRHGDYHQDVPVANFNDCDRRGTGYDYGRSQAASAQQSNDDVGWETVPSQRRRRNDQRRGNNEPPLPDISYIAPTSVNQKYQQFMLILAGVPGSGKSSFADSLVKGKPWLFVRVNQDTLGSRQECEDACRRALKDGKCPIVDRCNANPRQRKTFLDVAADFRVPVDCVVFQFDAQLCIRRCKQRQNHPTLGPDIAQAVINNFLTSFYPPQPNRKNTESFRNINNVGDLVQFSDLVMDYLSKLE